MISEQQLSELGGSGLFVSPIGLGMAALGRPGYINIGHANDLNRDYRVGAMEAHSHRVLDAAWDSGVRYFDAARSYGRAEQFLGSWLIARQIAPDQVTVGSKWGYTYTAGWQVQAQKHEVKEHSLPVLQRQIGESRALLGDYLDLYQIHSATLESGVLANQAVLGELAHLKEKGLRIGLSLSGPKQAETLRKALEVEVAGRLLFDTVQATWNLLEPSAGATLQEAYQAGLGVIVKEALANGRLTPRNDRADFADRRQLLEQVATEVGVGIDGLALAAALAQPWAGVVLSGAAIVEHLHENLLALSIHWNDDLAERLRPIVEPPETYWAIRSNLDWN
ncbi:MAG: aldo/keto reductase [Chloroflexota bacterium]|jgi:aryl-alcohol dehydrogenase-like predicted oxidoreductase